MSVTVPSFPSTGTVRSDAADGAVVPEGTAGAGAAVVSPVSGRLRVAKASTMAGSSSPITAASPICFQILFILIPPGVIVAKGRNKTGRKTPGTIHFDRSP